MRLNEINKPFDSDDINQVKEMINRKCKPFLKASGGNHIYRGMKDVGNFFIGEYPKNRQPKDIMPEHSLFFDKLLTQNGFSALRSNSIFVAGDELYAESYGTVYLIFPIGNFSFTWSNIINDLYTSLYEDNYEVLISAKVPRAKAVNLVDNENAKGILKEFIKLYSNTDLKTAIDSYNEIMITGGKYIAVKADFFNAEPQNKSNETPLEEGVNDKYIFKAIFTAGGPASGKSTISKKLLSHYGFKEVNVDRFVEYFANKNNLDLKAMQNWDNSIFDKSQELAGNSMMNWINGRLPLIIDGTGKNYQKIISMAERLESFGYDTGLLFVNTDLETTIERNKERHRTVDLKFLNQAWKQVQNNIGIFQDYFGTDMFIVDNSGPNVDLSPVSARIKRFIDRPVSNPVAKRWTTSKQPVTESIIKELFDTVVDLNWNTDVSGIVSDFTFAGVNYQVAFDDVGNPGEKVYEIVFGLKKENTTQLDINPKLSNRTDASKIYSIVFNIIEQFIKREQPNRLVFSGSKNQGLFGLYEKFLKYYEQKINQLGYETDTNSPYGFSIVNSELTESFDSTGDFEFVKNSNDIKKYRFEINGITYFVKFNVMAGPNRWELVYGSSKDETGFQLKIKPTNDQSSPLKVLSMVIKILESFIDEFKPNLVWFTGNKDTNLGPMYKKIVNALEPRLHAKRYDINHSENDEEDSFRITKYDFEDDNENF